jgi:hypothetical protein
LVVSFFGSLKVTFENYSANRSISHFNDFTKDGYDENESDEEFANKKHGLKLQSIAG